MQFSDRKQAGEFLAKKCKSLSIDDPIVLALPRGGVPVAFEVAKALNAPLDVLVLRKIGAPFHEELGIGAATEENYYWIDPRLADYVGATSTEIEEISKKERREVERRVLHYRQNRNLPNVRNRNVILVDDGLATGVTARVACAYIRQKGARQVILAVPVCSPDTAMRLRREVDQVICLSEPRRFMAVGQYYDRFEQTTDEEVMKLLSASGVFGRVESSFYEVSIGNQNVSLPGSFFMPPSAKGIVLFTHGSGSSRLSPRNQKVAKRLNAAGIGTLLFDLLSEKESIDRENIFDIPLLASRLELAVQWIRDQEEFSDLPLGFFGASTGGGAALWAAADLGDSISAVVSRGGRPDLALSRLPEVKAPTLLIVGGEDHPVLSWNQQALKKIPMGKIVVIPGATHLFDEPGAMDEVERQATAWFIEQFGGETQRATA